MSVREGVFQSKTGMNLLDSTVAVDRKAVNSGSRSSVVVPQCQVAFLSCGEIAYR